MSLIRRKSSGDAWETVPDAGDLLPDPITDPVTILTPGGAEAATAGLTIYAGDNIPEAQVASGLLVRGDAIPGGALASFASTDGALQVAVEENFCLTVNANKDGATGLGGAYNHDALHVTADDTYTPMLRVGPSGAAILGANAGPDTSPNAELNPGQCALWFDKTNGAAKLKITAKTADGTVVTGEIALSA